MAGELGSEHPSWGANPPRNRAVCLLRGRFRLSAGLVALTRNLMRHHLRQSPGGDRSSAPSLRAMTASGHLVLVAAWLVAVALLRGAAADVSRPGGAGHALLFRDHGVLLSPFNDLAPDAFTFEAWISTSDFCHRSALFSYALDSQSSDESQRTRDFNHFVLFDQAALLACHDFEYIDLFPDLFDESCAAKWNHSTSLPNYVERDGRWHHVAVSWTAANDGLTKVYWDGLLKVSAATGKTSPIRPGGALMLGAEQDCYGGCTDRGQGFFGAMDEVRLWRVERTQEQILAHMRDMQTLDNHPDLAAYWHFNDPQDNGIYRESLVARDASGRGNDLPLVTLPSLSTQRIDAGGGQAFDAGVASFRNNYAANQGLAGMPDRDVSVEFWARTPAYNATRSPDAYAEFLSFSSFSTDDGGRSTVFLDDAILIEKYMTEFSGTSWLDWASFSTRGSVSVHINANRDGNGQQYDHWIDFPTNWTDNAWHHVAVTWAWETGEVHLYFDGRDVEPYWVSQAGAVQFKDPARGPVDRHIAARSSRSSNGSLVLGQLQECWGGCFSPQYSLHGDLAALRVWSRVLSRDEVLASMRAADPPSQDGLALAWSFDPPNLVKDATHRAHIRDVHGQGANDLYLSADAPTWIYSTAPLALPDGKPVPPPTPGSAGHAMHLSDQQVLIHKNFNDFPSDEVTVEFWMLSTDACRKGTPFSYAAQGAVYAQMDNALELFDYNDWGIAVMEDEGRLSDHKSGVSATDGRWHHIAFTWRSSDGLAKLYDNGREVWSVTRARGKLIPSGGTLVVGREQDCEGGCFDSAEGAAGNVQEVFDQEYGPQDFFGVIDEMRVWRRARTPPQIVDGLRSNLFRKGMTGEKFDAPAVDPQDPDLVAYWTFDEGAGYTVKDITGRGHDLLAAEPPRWEVVRWLSVCGNGVVEGLEECDDGDLADGDGCSSECRVEEGWECTKASPSVCWRTGDKPHVDPRSRGGDPSFHPDAAGGGGSSDGQGGGAHGGHHGLAIALIALTVVGAVAAALFLLRDRIYDHLPQVERAAASLRDRLRRRRAGGLEEYHVGLEDADVLEMSPEAGFTAMRPPPSRGPYAPLPPDQYVPPRV